MKRDGRRGKRAPTKLEVRFGGELLCSQLRIFASWLFRRTSWGPDAWILEGL